MERNASLSWKAHPLPLAERTISSTCLRTETFSSLWLIWCCRKACSKSTAKPHPAGMPEVATTGSETAPLTPWPTAPSGSQGGAVPIELVRLSEAPVRPVQGQSGGLPAHCAAGSIIHSLIHSWASHNATIARAPFYNTNCKGKRGTRETD
eukprot:4776390-Amphidinium_carterae.1